MRAWMVNTGHAGVRNPSDEWIALAVLGAPDKDAHDELHLRKRITRFLDVNANQL